MMKSAALLTMAAYAGAVSLRGDIIEGVEQVGEQIENFPPDDYGMFVDRRILIADDKSLAEDSMANRLMEEYFEEEEFDADFAGEDYSDVMIMGDVVEGEDEEDFSYYYENDEEPQPLFKEYTRHPDTITLEGNSLIGEEGVGEYDHTDRHLATCGENEGDIKVILKTDKYAYETSWKIVNTNNNNVVASGPPSGTNYADQATYNGKWCLPPGSYNIIVNDRGGDGMCTGNENTFGCGFFKVYLNNQVAGQIVGDKSNWSSKPIAVNVAPVSSRIDGVSNNNSGQNWCNKVRSVMRVPTGSCTMTNGQRGHRVRVTTKVDKYGKETSWTVKKSGVTKMQMQNIIQANQQKAVEQCLPAGTYTLQVNDVDGICCRNGQGFFKLNVNGQELLQGGSFVKTTSHEFVLGFDWIASMSDRDCEWWWAHDYRRRDWHTRCYSGKYCNKSYRHLKWSPELKADASIYAEKLLSTCDSNTIKHDATEQGENLAKNKGSGNWGAKYAADKVTKRFMDNEEFWGWNRNAHLTQAAWRATRYIGCSESVKDMGNGKMCRMQVCRYAKAGNCMMGKYNAGTGNNWMVPMMMDDTPCGPMCPPGGCHQ